jgi:hypothetical protein
LDVCRRTVGPIGILQDENMSKSEQAWEIFRQIG